MNISASRRVGQTSQGFTIVELLIVIVVIAILAAVTIVAFRGVQDRATVASLSSDLSSSLKTLELYRIDHANAYPTTAQFSGVVLGGGATSYQYRVNNTQDPPEFCLTGTQKTTSYFIDSATKKPTEGACAGHSAGGVATITNLARYPRATSYSWVGAAKFQNDRWGSDGDYTLIAGQTPPTGTNLTTAARFTVATARSGHGFHLAGNPEAGGPTSTVSMSVAEGQTYTISLYVRWTGSGTPLRYSVSFRPGRTSDHTWTDATSTSTSVALTSGQWTRISHTYTVPAGSDILSAYTRAQGASDSVGDTHDVTGLMVTEGSTLYPYADGTSPGWIWNGADYATTSTGMPL